MSSAINCLTMDRVKNEALMKGLLSTENERSENHRHGNGANSTAANRLQQNDRQHGSAKAFVANVILLFLTYGLCMA